MTEVSAFSRVQPWISLVVRLGAAGIMIWAGVAKMQDISASVRATRAYRILPEALVPTVGTLLPYVEILVGFFLLAGLLTRWTAWVYLAMLAAFVVGIAWAWSQGYQIDCGCFGGGGDLAEGQTVNYVGHMVERAGYIALGVWLAIFPKSAFSADGWLHRADDE